MCSLPRLSIKCTTSCRVFDDIVNFFGSLLRCLAVLLSLSFFLPLYLCLYMCLPSAEICADWQQAIANAIETSTREPGPSVAGKNNMILYNLRDTHLYKFERAGASAEAATRCVSARACVCVRVCISRSFLQLPESLSTNAYTTHTIMHTQLHTHRHTRTHTHTNKHTHTHTHTGSNSRKCSRENDKEEEGKLKNRKTENSVRNLDNPQGLPVLLVSVCI